MLWEKLTIKPLIKIAHVIFIFIFIFSIRLQCLGMSIKN